MEGDSPLTVVANIVAGAKSWARPIIIIRIVLMVKTVLSFISFSPFKVYEKSTKTYSNELF